MTNRGLNEAGPSHKNTNKKVGKKKCVSANPLQIAILEVNSKVY